MIKLDLRQLRHVLALDRHRSFARAASELGLSQPALSRSILALEESIGAKLFDRNRSGVEPTVVGARLAELARPLLTQVRLAEQEIVQLLDLSSGMLRVGAGPYAAEISVGTAVGRLARRHPGIRAAVAVADWPELYRRLLADELDVVVAETSYAIGDDRFVMEPLPEHRGVYYCRAGHPLAGRVELTLEEVAAFPVAAPVVPRRLLPLVANSEPSLAVDLPEGTGTTEFRVETPSLARHIVMESDVLGVALRSQIERDVLLGRLVVLPLDVPWLKTSYGVLRLARRTPSPVAAEFLELLHTVERELCDQVAWHPAAREAEA